MHPKHAALLVLLLLTACADAPPPAKEEPAGRLEEVFRTIERRLLESTSLRIRARCDEIDRAESGAEERRSGGVTAFLRGGGQFAFEVKGVDADGDPVGAGLVSDGIRVSGRLGFRKPWAERDLPPSTREVLLSLMHRIGVARTTRNMVTLLGMGKSPQPSGMPAVSDFRAEESQDGVACLSYRVQDLSGRGFHGKLWYDAKTLQPLRRRTGVEDGKPGLTLDETYEELSAGVALPDAMFVLPDPDPASGRRFTHDGELMMYEERQDGVLRFVLVCDPGTALETKPDGIVLRRGGLTQTVRGTPGMMLIKGKRHSLYAIPAGWDHDLVQEYHEYRAAHPGALIADWMKAAMKLRPAPPLDAYLKTE